MIQWLVIDLGGVVARFRPQRRLKALERVSGIDADAIRLRLFDSGFDEQAELGLIPRDTMLERTRSQLGSSTDDKSLLAAWSLAFEPDIAVLDTVTVSHARRCLFTNNGPIVSMCLERQLPEIAQPFDRVICSWELGAVKPDRVAFMRLLETLGASAQDVLLIDDSERNVNAARAVGINAEIHENAEVLGRTLAAHGML